ncbi:MAG: matrixin family metalloprotease [Phycisphaerae bacterium]
MVVVQGCGSVWPGSILQDSEGDGRRQTTLSSTVVLSDDVATYHETSPNNLFELAEPVDVTTQPRDARDRDLLILGRISGPEDVDVFDLGPVYPGDHVTVDVDLAESLDGAIGLFDVEGTALLINDHRNVYLGVRRPFVDVVIQRESAACYIGVSSTPGYDSRGDYALVASNQYPVEIPPPRTDTILLDFDGGHDVKVGSRAAIDVPPFDAANISAVFTGHTDRVISRVVEFVREDYAGLDVTILSTWEGDLFEPGMTRIYFGTYDQALLGVAEGVDEFNAVRQQEAIIFTDTFAAFMKLNPTVEEISQALANVTSHEIGHLLGLVHTDDPTGIMDVTASLREMLVDQAFTRSPIYSAVFGLGFQDAPRYLIDVVGGDPDVLATKTRRSSWRIARAVQESLRGGTELRKPARAQTRFSTCGLEDH